MILGGVFCLSHGRSLRLPRVSAGYIRLTCGVPHSTCVMGPLLLPTRMEVLALSLTAQARSVRVPVPRGTMHASGDSPHHLSAKNLRVGYCRLRRRDYSRPLASELDVKVSLHPAQAWNNAPGCACGPALAGRGFDTVSPLA